MMMMMTEEPAYINGHKLSGAKLNNFRHYSINTSFLWERLRSGSVSAMQDNRFPAVVLSRDDCFEFWPVLIKN